MESTPSDSHRRSGRKWIAIVVPALLVVVVAISLTVPITAPAHWLLASATGTAGQVQVEPQVPAIQGVIQRANAEQSQALSSGNPSVMSDTATAAYYRQLVQINQSLAAQGATSLNLIRLSWGPVNVTGSTATATTSEAWTTTFSDGTTTESSDTNVYSLVQQGGTWLIEADQHTASASAQATPGIGAQPAPQTPLPVTPVGQNTSHNWSGYAATSGTYTGVSGTWNVPVPGIHGTPGVGATWVGIGGVSSRDLIQAGTQDVAAGGGQAQFQSWIEMLPAAAQQVPVAVVPGDSITVSIDEQGGGSGNWQISITNNTTGQSYQTNVQYASSESSVEWVMEAPSGSRGVLPLDNFNSVSFTAASAIQGGQTVDLSQTGAQPITMLNAENQPLAVPSPIGANGASFDVARTSAPASTSAPRRGQGGGPAPTGQGG